MAIPALLAGTGKLAMQVLPFLPGIASAAQGNYGQGAAQAATAYGLGKIPGVGKLAGMGPAGQAAALGIQSLGGAVGGNMIADIAGSGVNAVGGLFGMGESGALQRGKEGFLGGDAVYSSPAMQRMAEDAVMATRLGNEEQLRAMEASYGINQKYAQANQMRYQQNVAQQANLQGQLQRQAGAINLANAGMQQNAATQRALIQSSNPYIGKIF